MDHLASCQRSRFRVPGSIDVEWHRAVALCCAACQWKQLHDAVTLDQTAEPSTNADQCKNKIGEFGSCWSRWWLLLATAKGLKELQIVQTIVRKGLILTHHPVVVGPNRRPDFQLVVVQELKDTTNSNEPSGKSGEWDAFRARKKITDSRNDRNIRNFEHIFGDEDSGDAEEQHNSMSRPVHSDFTFRETEYALCATQIHTNYYR